MDPIQQSFCVTHRRDFSATSLATFRAAEMASNAEYCRNDSYESPLLVMSPAQTKSSIRIL